MWFGLFLHLHRLFRFLVLIENISSQSNCRLTWYQVVLLLLRRWLQIVQSSRCRVAYSSATDYIVIGIFLSLQGGNFRWNFQLASLLLYLALPTSIIDRHLRSWIMMVVFQLQLATGVGVITLDDVLHIILRYLELSRNCRWFCMMRWELELHSTSSIIGRKIVVAAVSLIITLFHYFFPGLVEARIVHVELIVTSATFTLTFTQLLVWFIRRNFTSTDHEIRGGRLLLEVFPTKLMDNDVLVLDESAAGIGRLVCTLV